MTVVVLEGTYELIAGLADEVHEDGHAVAADRLDRLARTFGALARGEAEEDEARALLERRRASLAARRLEAASMLAECRADLRSRNLDPSPLDCLSSSAPAGAGPRIVALAIR